MWRRLIKTYKYVHMEEILTKTRIHSKQDSNKHPDIWSEGDKLWIELMEEIPIEDKKRLEKSEYGFYYQMVEFLEKNTPYSGAIKFAKNKMKEIYNEMKGTLGSKKVTVIIPFYNRIELLLKTIESLKKQTHKNLEILLINDGSTDNIEDLKSSIQKDQRFKIIDLGRNFGPAKARNEGIDNSTGEYIAFLDSDDEFLPEKIEEQLLLMELTKYDVSHTSYIRRHKTREEIVNTGKLSGIVIPEIVKSCQIATPTAMIKTKYLNDNKFRFREDMRVGEDTCFWLDILRNTKLLGIDRPLTIVNVNPDSAANDPKKHLEGLTNILGYLFTDKEYSQYAEEISNLCNRYVEIVEEIKLGKESGYQVQEKLASKNKLTKLFYLFKYQGVLLTIKKIIWKYGPRIFKKIEKDE
jgi:hypothetical protein